MGHPATISEMHDAATDLSRGVAAAEDRVAWLRVQWVSVIDGEGIPAATAPRL